MPRRKRIFTVLVTACVVAVTLLYASRCFFFSPSTYRRCAAAYLPWTWYKNPLQLEYGVLDEDGWKFTKTTDKSEIHTVFTELSLSVQQSVGDHATAGDGAQVWFGVRRLSDGAILLSAEGLEHSPYFQVK
ncbi:MAG TPA: hypothetical protein DDZ53_10385, partial [Firmicutes bacterium]|nr:hypothetical protein [Bacillota bacterium]